MRLHGTRQNVVRVFMTDKMAKQRRFVQKPTVFLQSDFDSIPDADIKGECVSVHHTMSYILLVLTPQHA